LFVFEKMKKNSFLNFLFFFRAPVPLCVCAFSMVNKNTRRKKRHERERKKERKKERRRDDNRTDARFFLPRDARAT